MYYFEQCKTVRELNKKYFDLAQVNHPSKGGNKAMWQTITSQFGFVAAQMVHAENLADDVTAERIDMIKHFGAAIESAICLPDTKLDITDVWLWVTGKTYAVKDTLYAAGYSYGSKRAAWYFKFGMKKREPAVVEPVHQEKTEPSKRKRKKMANETAV